MYTAYICSNNFLMFTHLELNNKTDTDLFNKFLIQTALRPKCLWSQSHIFLCLWIKCWVLNKTIDEHPQMILDLEGVEGKTSFASFPLDYSSKLFNDLIHNIVDMGTTLKW